MTAQQQQTPAEQTPPGVINIPDENSPPAPVDVDVDAGTAVEAPETPAAQTPAAAPRTTPRPQARIQNLTHERDQERAERVRLENELADMRRIAQEAQAGKEHAERAGMQNLVQRTKADVASAKAALKQAKEAGNIDAEVEAQALLARVSAEEADADAWVKGQPKEGEQPQAQPQQRQPQRAPEMQPVPAAVRDFISENTWFHPFKMGDDGLPQQDRRTGQPIGNPDYDADMHDAAMIEHRVIQRAIKAGTLPKDFEGTPDYFDRIRTKIQTEFADAFDPPEETPPEAPRRGQPAMGAPKQGAAPSTRNVPTQQAPKQGTKMRLDGEQASLVRSLVDNGTMRYPHTHADANKRGQKMSYDDAYVQYARNAQADAVNRGNNQQ